MSYKIPALIFCVFILTLSSEESYGAYKSGAMLHEECTERKSSQVYHQQTADCRGYILGVHDTWVFAIEQSLAVIPNYRYCLPEGVNSGQLQAIVTKFLKENPETWHFSAASLVVAALEEAFPCI